jgi:hypothetical protein
MKQKIILNTAGNGLWSNTERAVRIKDMRIGPFIDDEFEPGGCPDYGELCVKFDTKTWDTRKHGLIYTDRLFLKELREFLNQHGLPGKDVEYSEQGMQGDDYVSLDVGKKFMKAWGKKFGLNWDAVVRQQPEAFLKQWS